MRASTRVSALSLRGQKNWQVLGRCGIYTLSLYSGQTALHIKAPIASMTSGGGKHCLCCRIMPPSHGPAATVINLRL